MRRIAIIFSVIVLVVSVLAEQRHAINRNDTTLTMIYSSFLGGSQVDDCDAIATDSKGDIYLGCHSDSPNLPGSASAPYALKGDLDAFVIKLDSKASRVLYLAQVGGRDWEGAMGIAVDSTGAAYITGSTYSPDFPTTAGAFQRAFAGDNDAFVVKVSPTGSIVYATFLGGKGRDDGRRIALDRSGAAYVVGSTNSPDFPATARAAQPRYGGDTDAFVAKLSPSGALLYSTYLGGSSPDNGFDIAVNSSGNAYVTGNSRSANFPVVKSLQKSLRGDSDAFIARLNTTGSVLLFSTYLGGSDFEYGHGIALDVLNRIFLTGSTMSSDFPTSRGAFQTTFGGKWDGFVAKLTAPGNSILYSSYLGGAGDEGGAQIAVNAKGHAYIVGGTESGNFPTARPMQASMNGTKDGFLAEISPTGTSLLFSTYLGGDKRELFEDVALDAKGAVIVSGLTSSDDFPVVRGMQNIFGGAMYDIVVAKFARARTTAVSHVQLSQQPQTFQRTINKTVNAKYLLFLPQDYGKQEKRWPLILYLHGGSRRGDDIEMVRAISLPQIVEKDLSFPFIVVSPQCPQGEIWTDTDTLINLLDEVMNKYAVDRERVYLTGHSMGGRGAWYLAYKYPERFAAIAPMAGPATISSWAAKLKEMPIWVFHGAKDTDVPLSESEQMVNALKAFGNNVKFTIYPDRDHFILDTYENKDLYKWFLQHKRVTK